jgi:2-succinyl-5-enolpyruvyl-6-hydroxy-3-cyclohexene-1-carboxylate synthase
LQAFIQDADPKHYIMVLNHPLRNDPLHRVTLRIESGVDTFCDSVLKSIKPRKEKGYVVSLRKASDKVFETIAEHGRKQSSLDVPAVIYGICKLTSEKAGLFLSNSMSIRVMDMFASPNDNLFIIGANRGASGIDGIIASASGFAKGLNAPCVLLLGDLAFLHDLNSLSLLKSIAQPFVIVVLNDDGGGIFSFLPIAGFPEVFEKYFAAPHGLNFEMTGKMFGIPYSRPKEYHDFADTYKRAFQEKGAAIIEISLNRRDNVKTIKSLQKQILEK